MTDDYSDDYISTQILPQRLVTAAISGSPSERRRASDLLDSATHGERIVKLDQTVGQVVIVQVSHERQIAELDRRMDVLERELRTEMAMLRREVGRIWKYTALGLLVLVWVLWRVL